MEKAKQQAELLRIQLEPLKEILPHLDELLFAGTHAVMGALIAIGNKQNPALGALQASMVGQIAKTPFARSDIGAGLLSTAYAWMAIDMSQLDQTILSLYQQSVDTSEDFAMSLDEAIMSLLNPSTDQGEQYPYNPRGMR